MKKNLFLAILLAITVGIRAQRITKEYKDAPLPKVLMDLNDLQSDYTISFIYDDLRDFTVTANIKRQNVEDAIHQVVGLNNIKVKTVGSTILVECGEIGHRLKGTIIDNNSNPIEFANIQLLSPKDSTYITGGVSNESGKFVIPCANTLALMRVSYIGMKTLTRVVNITDIGTIKMQADEYSLKEVKVKGRLPKTQLKDGAMITNVAGTILERAGTAEQLLNRLPSLTAKDGNVEVLGRGTPIIYINGRRMRDSGELDRMSSEDVKSVEVITSPGARYETSVTSVVRIVTKPKVGDGFGFDSRTVARRREPGLWTGVESAQLNYRKNGFDASGTLYYHQSAKREDRDITNYTFLDKTWRNNQNVRQTYEEKDLFTKLALSYMIDDKNSIGASLSFDRYPEETDDGDLTANLFIDDALSETNLSHANMQEQSSALNGNAYYVGKIGIVGIDFNTDWYWNKDNISMWTKDMSQQSDNVNTETNTHNSLIASKLMLTVPLLGGELNFGGEYSFSKKKTLYDVVPKNIIDDEDSRIEEGMTSAFLEYSRDFGKLSLNAGLRYEYIDFKYYDHDAFIAEQSHTFSDLFPSVSLSMPVGKTQMMLTYSADVARPSYWMLRSDILYVNKFTYQTGNPFLLPQTSRNLGYTLSYKWLMFSAMWSHIKNTIGRTSEMFNGDPTILLIKFDNINNYDRFHVLVGLNPTIGIWSPMLSVSMAKQWYDLVTFDGHDVNNPQFTIRLNNTLETKFCDITLSTETQTEGGSKNTYTTEGYFVANLTLRKSFLQKRLSLQLDIDDLFHTGNEYERFYCGAFQAADQNNFHQQSVSLTLRYKFNTAKSKYKGTGAGQSQKSRM